MTATTTPHPNPNALQRAQEALRAHNTHTNPCMACWMKGPCSTRWGLAVAVKLHSGQMEGANDWLGIEGGEAS